MANKSLFFYNKKKKIVFLRIPKNASWSFGGLLLEGFEEQEDITEIDFQIHIFFTVVRNPLERFISAYFNKYRELNLITPNTLFNYKIKHPSVWDKKITIDMFLPEIEKVKNSVRENGWTHSHETTFQKYYLGGTHGLDFIPIDYYLLFENLEADFDRLMRPYLDISSNWELPFYNKGVAPKQYVYIKEYLKDNPSVEEEINEIYKEDWKLYLEQPKRKKED